MRTIIGEGYSGVKVKIGNRRELEADLRKLIGDRVYRTLLRVDEFRQMKVVGLASVPNGTPDGTVRSSLWQVQLASILGHQGIEGGKFRPNRVLFEPRQGKKV